MIKNKLKISIDHLAPTKQLILWWIIVPLLLSTLGTGETIDCTDQDY